LFQADVIFRISNNDDPQNQNDEIADDDDEDSIDDYDQPTHKSFPFSFLICFLR